MYSWLNGFYCKMNKYSITLFFFDSKSQRALLRLCPLVISIASKRLKSSQTCLIGYSVFISHDWFFIAWWWTHRYTHTLPGQKQFQETRYKAGLKIQCSLFLCILEEWAHFTGFMILHILVYSQDNT